MAHVTAEVLSEKCSRKCIAHFTNGKINDSRSDDLTLGQFVKAGNDRKRRQTILVAETPTMSYIGKTFGPDASKAQTYCRYYVGVVDRKRGKMKVFDSEIIQMVPKLPDFQEEEEKEKTTIPSDLSKTYKQKIDDLTASFGSKRKKQAMGSRLRNEIHGEALEKALNSAVVDAVSQKKNVQVVAEDSQSSLLPPFNPDATSPKDVYSLDSIISQNVRDAMVSVSQGFYDSTKKDVKAWETNEEYPKYILNHLAVLPSSTESRWLKCKILMYLHYLITLFRLPAQSIRVKDPLPRDWPGPVRQSCYDQFTLLVDSGQRKVRCCPARLKDKLVLQILVLCLIIDEFDLPLNDIQKDLKMGGKSLDSHVRALGCKVKTQKLATEDGEKLELKTAILETPLRFPENLPKKAKARR